MLPNHKPLQWILPFLVSLSAWLGFSLFSTGAKGVPEDSAHTGCLSAFSGTYTRLHSDRTVDLCELTRNKTVLLVNTASHCGFTPQFKQLEVLHQKYASAGLVVVGVPSDDFSQEADSEAETASVCFRNFGVTFTMLAPNHVKGSEAIAPFRWVGEQTRAPAWNFNKYLITGNGSTVTHWGSSVNPLDSGLEKAIIQSLDHALRAKTQSVASQ